jgi:molybdopterin-guanine dinucleotide biosynthesis protein A
MTAPIPAVILAGGQATRMGGGDKCLRRIGPDRLIDLVIARLAPQVGAMVLNANGETARFSELGLPVIPDSVAGFVGPLAGVLAGMDWAATQGFDHIVSVAADTPFFPQDLVARLCEQGPLALAATREHGKIYRQPTFGLWPVALRDDLRAALADGLRKVVVWTDSHNAGQAVWPVGNVDPFFNINTPDDIAWAEAQF